MRLLLCWRTQLPFGGELLKSHRDGDDPDGRANGPHIGPPAPVEARSWIERCELIRNHEVRDDDRLIAFRGRAQVLDFFRRVAADANGMRSLRLAHAELGPGFGIERMDDGKVVEQLSWRFADGTIRIAARPGQQEVGEVAAAVVAAESSEPAEPAARRPAAPRSSPGNEAVTTPAPSSPVVITRPEPTRIPEPVVASLDTAAQTEKMRLASVLGSAFIEVCAC